MALKILLKLADDLQVCTFRRNPYPTWCVSALLVRKLDEFKAIAADKATTMATSNDDAWTSQSRYPSPHKSAA